MLRGILPAKRELAFPDPGSSREIGRGCPAALSVRHVNQGFEMPKTASNTAIGEMMGAGAASNRSARVSASGSRVRMATMAEASTNIRRRA